MHGAGVTAILPFPETNNEGEGGIHGDDLDILHIKVGDNLGDPQHGLILTGSYDDHLRVYDPVKRSVHHEGDFDLGGGVWRLKFLPNGCFNFQDSRSDTKHPGLWRVLASCMYAGAQILQLEHHDSGWTCTTVANFKEHKSMNYASDYHYGTWKGEGGGKEQRLLIVSTSFYDKLLCVWEVNEDISDRTFYSGSPAEIVTNLRTRW
jgi:hypothetical protein